MTTRERRRIMKIAETMPSTREDWSLYKSLHHVGDDSTKGLIEDTLSQLLSPEQFRLVRAVFVWATADKR